MVYRAIGLMSGSSLDGLDISFVEFQEASGKWTYSVLAADCFPFETSWINRLSMATSLSARDYLLLHNEFGHYLGKQVNNFIEKYGLEFKVQLISSHGHTSFHLPTLGMTAQLGNGAAIAAETGINVVSDLRSIDIALGGQGAPIVPIGEKLLWGEYELFLNIGGIANLSAQIDDRTIAFDVCAANRVLNLLANEVGKPYDDAGQIAASGTVDNDLLAKLNQLEYYRNPYPKSLANEFGTETVFQILKNTGAGNPNLLRTYTQHIAEQVAEAVRMANPTARFRNNDPRMLITGGGALNKFLISCIEETLANTAISVVIPSRETVEFKEAIVMALIGVLRWRENSNVLSSVTGARQDSIGGCVYLGQ